METMTMTREEKAINSTLFNVSKRQGVDGKLGLFTDDGYKLSDVSEGYKLINNAEIIKPFIDRFGYGAFKRVQTIGNGKSVLYEIETGKDIVISEGDTLRQRLLVVNSYDKTKAFKFILGAFRSYCFNGLYNGIGFANVQKVHMGKFEIADIVSNVLADHGKLEVYDHWKRMANVETTEADNLNFIQGFKAYDVEEGKLYTTNDNRNKEIIRIAGQYYNSSWSRAPKEKNTVWGLYNRINWSIGKAFRTKDTREYIKINNRLEASLLKHFSIN